jgi:apolipoprotein D and lipocalin family protein
MKTLIVSLGLLMVSACSAKYERTVNFVDRDKFMGAWNVQAGRFTFLEKDVHNAVESYSWNIKEERIDIDFRYNQGSFDGEVKKVPQKGWIYNHNTNAHWKVSPFWPLKLDYLIIALGQNYEWTAIGVPNQKYLWIMTREKQVSKEKIKAMIEEVKAQGYRVDNLVFVPHSP